MQSVHTNTTNL